MPIYEYRCRECQAEFEKLVFGSGAAGDIRCPGCRSAEIEQVYSCFNGVSRSSDGSTHSMSSGCSSCSSSSCAGCKGH